MKVIALDTGVQTGIALWDSDHPDDVWSDHLPRAAAEDFMEEYIRKGQLAEPIVLMERFKQDPAFQELGGLRYLADLVDRAPPAANAADYGRLVYDLALRRDLIRIGGEIASTAHGGGGKDDVKLPARDQIEAAEQQLYTLAESGTASSGPHRSVRPTAPTISEPPENNATDLPFSTRM